ncbi:helix-turn-helix domain-containing protein [Janthinobacterium sp. LB2P70]|uniref:helix-turn-helix domain-containing protein n=1 Tax=Janthinobacterium sp. LB2P70 TaxID=3424197 RepID=UPI003F24765F
MGRKSALTEKQWAAVGQRLLKGEAARALAREFGVSEAAIRKRFGAQTKQIKDVAINWLRQSRHLVRCRLVRR